MPASKSQHQVDYQGMETKDIVWYITHYIAKKQRELSNTSALLAKTFVFHQTKEERNFDLIARNKLLLQHCANTLSHEQELSGPKVVSYLMGWGDCYISHHFETLPWFSVLSALRNTFPVLQKERYNRSVQLSFHPDIILGHASLLP
jgi:hypothetical protein